MLRCFSRLGAAILVLALASIGPASAQQPSAAALATAKELLSVKGSMSIYDPLVNGIVEKAKLIFLRTNPMLGKDLNEVAAKLRAEYGPRIAEVVNETARLYALRFSEQELKDALAFYKSPVGRKLVAEEPAIAEQSMKWTAAWADKLSEEVVGKMRGEMKKRGHEI
jgi:uncharacterized protein